jgi:hypothetical protein
MGPKDGLAALADKKREMTRSGAIVHPHPIPPPFPFGPNS